MTWKSSLGTDRSRKKTMRNYSSLWKKSDMTHSLKKKLILSVLLLLALFIIIFLMNNIVLNAMLMKRTSQSVTKSIRLADISLSYFLEQAKEQAYRLSAEVTERADIKSLLCGDEDLSVYAEYKATKQYITELTKIGLTGGVESIYVYSGSRGKLITSNNGVFRVQEIPEYKWLQEARTMQGDNALKWIGHCRYLNELQWDAYMISLICKAHTINRGINHEVYFGLNFNESLIYDVFKDIGITPHSMAYLTDESGVILSAGNKDSIGVNLNELLDADIFGGFNGESARIIVGGERFVRFIAVNDTTNWNIVLLVPEWELFKERRIYWLIISLCISVVITGIILIAYKTIVRYVDTPVMKLVKFMKKAEKGDFGVRITDTRKDEFGLLYTGFNEMVGKIDILIRELYQEKLLKRDVELKYLQKLINPHFLYNTLDTLNWLARENRLSDVSALTLALSNQYRTIFNRGQEYIPLGVCLQNITDYLFIHKVRYGGTFSYRIHMEDAISDVLVLNLTLQPAVENALMHGIQNRDKAGGKVVISARLRKNRIRVRIFDNGAGMWKEKLKILRMNMRSDRKSNDSGLKIVHQRIKLFYGSQYGISIHSSFRKGTCVSFVFPAWEYIDPQRSFEFSQSESLGIFNDERQKLSLL